MRHSANWNARSKNVLVVLEGMNFVILPRELCYTQKYALYKSLIYLAKTEKVGKQVWTIYIHLYSLKKKNL